MLPGADPVLPGMADLSMEKSNRPDSILPLGQEGPAAPKVYRMSPWLCLLFPCLREY